MTGIVNEPQQAVLISFSTQVHNLPFQVFSAGSTSEDKIVIGKSIALSGSTEPSDILVHSHDRIIVYTRDLLNGNISVRAHFLSFKFRSLPESPIIQSSPNIHPLEGLRLAWNLPNHARILGYAVPSQAGLPSVSGNRVLVYRKLARKYVLYVLDFDQERVNSLVAKDSQERDELRAQLAELGARVKVITRRFRSLEEGVGGGFMDAEYPPRHCPVAWRDHIQGIQERDKEEHKAGLNGSEPLEYDEAPEEHREPMPFGFVESVMRLEKDISWQDIGRMAITTGCVVRVPEPGQLGVIYDF